MIEANTWSTGGYLAVALVFFTVFWMTVSLKMHQHVIVPKTSDELINGLFSGAPAGTVMCSYSRRQHPTEKTNATLGYKGTHIQRVACILPCRWLDQDMLLPGIDLQKACIQAARNCKCA